MLPPHLEYLTQTLVASDDTTPLADWAELQTTVHGGPLCPNFQQIAATEELYTKLWKRSLQCQIAAIRFIRQEKRHFFRALHGDERENWQNVLLLNQMDAYLFTQQKAIGNLFEAIHVGNFHSKQITEITPKLCDQPCHTHKTLFDAQAWLQAEDITIIIPFFAYPPVQQYQFRLDDIRNLICQEKNAVSSQETSQVVNQPKIFNLKKFSDIFRVTTPDVILAYVESHILRDLCQDKFRGDGPIISISSVIQIMWQEGVQFSSMQVASDMDLGHSAEFRRARPGKRKPDDPACFRPLPFRNERVTTAARADCAHSTQPGNTSDTTRPPTLFQRRLHSNQRLLPRAPVVVPSTY